MALSAALAGGALRDEALRIALGEAGPAERSALGFLEVRARSGRAVEVRWCPSEEATALLTLLGLYETRSSATFHSTLKTLCDLYGLRKDDFDRLHAEATYLDGMNSARSDKARLCDYVVPGSIVEVGPGGGVVLDLLAERFEGSTVLGLDSSHAVIDALSARRLREGRRWSVPWRS